MNFFQNGVSTTPEDARGCRTYANFQNRRMVENRGIPKTGGFQNTIRIVRIVARKRQKRGIPKKGDSKLYVSWQKGGSQKNGGFQTVRIVAKRGIPKKRGIPNCTYRGKKGDPKKTGDSKLYVSWKKGGSQKTGDSKIETPASPRSETWITRWMVAT